MFKIQWNEVKDTHVAVKRTYDVRVTLNKAGDSRRMVIRFGFINDALKAFSKDYIEASKITGDRIYFRTFNEKANGNVHKISKVDKGAGRYFSMTVSPEQEKIYRAKWINGTFKLKYDEENELYFIELEKTA